MHHDEWYFPEYVHSLLTPERYQEMMDWSLKSPEDFWAYQAKEFLLLRRPWEKVLSYNYHEAEIRWFEGAQLNVCENCVDRHLPTRAQKAALLWEGNEPGESRVVTYQELYDEVNRTAQALRTLEVKKGDRVILYLPMTPEAVICMLACTRIGAVHSVVFAGFSAESLKGRILDSGAKLVITADSARRGPKEISLKAIVDQAVEGTGIEKVIVVKRTNSPVSLIAGRDVWYDEVRPKTAYVPPEPMDAEDPLFILYTSGSTGKPKGVLHTQMGYLLYAAFTHKYLFDYQEKDVHFCTADIGWITGHTYVAYGPLANGATTVLFEPTPVYPDPGRYWSVVEKWGVTQFYTAPTAIRTLAREEEKYVTSYDRSSIRILGSVGEPINPDAWKWYYTVVGNSRCPIIDTWWQTETGATLISPIPGINRLYPGSATRSLFGVQPLLVDDEGKEITEQEATGNLCLRAPWPGQMRGVYGDPSRFKEAYFTRFPGLYFTGDSCIRDANGNYWIIGRVDDVLNVSGHRIGTAELEAALVASHIVAEAAVVGAPHEIKGTGIHAFCVLRHDLTVTLQEIEKQVAQAVRTEIGGFALPERIIIVPGLPKTRSGKIMRRILRAIAQGERQKLGDTSTLADPSIVEQILAKVE